MPDNWLDDTKATEEVLALRRALKEAELNIQGMVEQGERILRRAKDQIAQIQLKFGTEE